MQSKRDKFDWLRPPTWRAHVPMPSSDDNHRVQSDSEPDDFERFLSELEVKVYASRPEKPKPSILKRLWGYRSYATYLAPVLAAFWVLSVYSFILEALPWLAPPVETGSTTTAAYSSIARIQIFIDPLIQWYREITHPFAKWQIALLNLRPAHWMPDYLLALWFSIGAAARNASYEIRHLETPRYLHFFPLLRELFSRSTANRWSLLAPLLKAFSNFITLPVYLLVFSLTFPVRRPISRLLSRFRKWYTNQHRQAHQQLIAQIRMVYDDPVLSHEEKRRQVRIIWKDAPPDPDLPGSEPYFDVIYKSVLAVTAFLSVLIGMAVILLMIFLAGKISR
jgi:hypothetical protein